MGRFSIIQWGLLSLWRKVWKTSKSHSSVPTPSVSVAQEVKPSWDSHNLDHVPNCRLSPCPKMGSNSHKPAMGHLLQHPKRKQTQHFKQMRPSTSCVSFPFPQPNKVQGSERLDEGTRAGYRWEIAGLISLADVGKWAEPEVLKHLWLWGKVS